MSEPLAIMAAVTAVAPQQQGVRRAAGCLAADVGPPKLVFRGLRGNLCVAVCTSMYE
jgi:hypothetical protein